MLKNKNENNSFILLFQIAFACECHLYLFSFKKMDPIDEISNLNMQAYNEGYEEGIQNGKQSAVLKGFQIGKQMSMSVCKELGQYYGAIQALRVNKTNDQLMNDQKCQRLMEQICSLIDEFDWSDCHSDQFNLKLTSIRDKYKQICSLTNMKTYTDQINFSPKASKFSF